MDPLVYALEQARDSIETLHGKQYKAARAMWDVMNLMMLAGEGNLLPSGARAIPMEAVKDWIKTNTESKPPKKDTNYL